ncbi:MAG: BatD family protein [Bacteroidota bacterium]
MKTIRYILLFGMHIIPLGIFGQDKVFTASAPAVVQAGQQFQYTISGNDQGDVQLPSMEHFDLLAGPFSSYSSQSQWVNGRMSMNTVVTYSYIYRAREEGEFTIAPATIRVGRKTYETNEVQINVTQGAAATQPQASQGAQSEAGNTEGADESIFLRLIPSKNELYIGEQMVCELKIYTSVNTRPAGNNKEVSYEGFFSKMIDPDQVSQREVINGRTYVTQVIQRHILIPQKAGDLTIQPFSMDWIVQKQAQRKRTGSIFDDPFFNDPFFNSRVEEVPVTLSTKPLTLHVKALPSPAPEGFTGAVGSFSMKTELSQEEVKVNEALSLKITVSGTGNLNLMGNPLVSLPPDHDVYDVTKKVSSDVNGNRISGSVVFEYPIVARHAGKYRISPVKFSWFDPATGSYKSETSKEFVFTVLKGEGQDEANGQIFVPGRQGRNVEDIGTDIRDIIRTAPDLKTAHRPVFSSTAYRLFYPLSLLVFFLLIFLMKNRIKRNADIRLVRNRKAGRIARERLKTADRFRKAGDHERFYEETGKAIWSYLADKLLIDLSQLSRDAVKEKLNQAGIPDAKADELLMIVDACEFARFAPASERENVDKVFSETLALIRSVEETI